MRRGILMTLLVLVVGSGVILRGRDAFGPWDGRHKAWGGAVYGNIARNLLRYDVAETFFAPLTNTGPVVSQAEFEYYYHYPPLVVSMVAASFRVFGVHEGSARVVPLAFSLLTMALVFAFALRFWDRRTAVAALVIVSFLPVEIYYADHVDVYGPPAVFFSLLAVFGYAVWFQERRRRYLALALGAIVLGCLTAWFTYFVAALLSAHALFVAPRTRRPQLHVAAAPALAAVVVFGAFLLHRHLLPEADDSEVMGTLVEKLLIRSDWTELAVRTDTGWVAASLPRFAAHIGRLHLLMLGLPAVVLAAGWVAGALVRIRSGLPDRDWFLLVLLGFGLLHGLAFPMLLPGHDFLQRAFAPGVALAGAVALTGLANWLQSRWGAPVGTTVLIAGLGLTTVVGVAQAREMRSPSAADQLLKDWGTWVRGVTAPETVLLFAGGQDRVFGYYLERRTRWDVTSEAELVKALAPGSEYVFVMFERDVSSTPGLVAALEARGAPATWNGLRLYRPPATPPADDGRARNQSGRDPSSSR